MKRNKMKNARQLRKFFIKYLTVDSETQDMRRKDFNQAIFDKDEGWACFEATDLSMVLNAFDMAVKELNMEECEGL
jgi:hypothetical protein